MFPAPCRSQQAWLLCSFAMALPVPALADDAGLYRESPVHHRNPPARSAADTWLPQALEGQVGPRIDELKPDKARVLEALQFVWCPCQFYMEQLSETDMRALAAFVPTTGGALWRADFSVRAESFFGCGQHCEGSVTSVPSLSSFARLVFTRQVLCGLLSGCCESIKRCTSCSALLDAARMKGQADAWAHMQPVYSNKLCCAMRPPDCCAFRAVRGQ